MKVPDKTRADLRAARGNTDRYQLALCIEQMHVQIADRFADDGAALLEIGADENALILDSFAGSGTTAHAVLKANAKDGGQRKFILVEGEAYADTLTAERVRRGIKFYGIAKAGVWADYTRSRDSEQLLAEYATMLKSYLGPNDIELVPTLELLARLCWAQNKLESRQIPWRSSQRKYGRPL